MGRVLTAATAALFMVGVFAAPAGANDNSGGRNNTPTTTVAPTTTTVAPTTTTVAPAPTPTTAPPAPAPGPVAMPTPAPTTPPRRTTPPAPTPVATPTTVPAPTTTTTVPPAQPAVTAGVDCVEGIVIGATNTGGEAANLTIVVDGNVVGDLVAQPGGTETFVFDLNPADAGTAKVVQVFHGDVAIYDQPLTVECGSFAATPCEAVTTAGTPAMSAPTDNGCTNPCWWAPAALVLGVAIGRRRRNGKYNPAGIAAGIAGVFLALTGAGLAPLAWAGLAAAAIAGAVKLTRRNPDDTPVEEAETTDAAEADATDSDEVHSDSKNTTEAEEAKAETA